MKLPVPYCDDFQSFSKSEPLPYAICHENWTHRACLPATSFDIAWNETFLFLKYVVKEKEVMARIMKEQGPVYRDSCVEAFLTPQGCDEYVNIECNILGFCRVTRGTRRENRSLIDNTEERVKRFTSYEKGKTERVGGYYNWTVLLKISLETFALCPPCSLSGQIWRGNFYKCGDDLLEPHYLSWNPIAWATPDFHRPEFFGEIHFT